jgi:hypothetical protein
LMFVVARYGGGQCAYRTPCLKSESGRSRFCNRL